VRILCDYLTVYGLLTKNGGSYGLNATSANFLDRRSPAYMGTVAHFLASPETIDGFRDLTAVVRKGGSIKTDSALETENPMWVNFARSMVPLIMPAAQQIAALVNAAGNRLKVLDIAAGHGMFGITIASTNPNAEIVAVDWRNILAVAQENADKAQLASRFRTLPGSAFDVDFGTDYDVVLLTNFLHHFDSPTCETLLKKVHAALKPGGRAITLEFVPNDDRVSPRVPATFSMVMLGGTPSGDAYTFAELKSMFQRAGFTRSELHNLNASPEQLVVSYKG
jgi:2-polyprenyl-3-methyl-5-hydroxy-6-metoxy-1,4-benzoquinol methylase